MYACVWVCVRVTHAPLSQAQLCDDSVLSSGSLRWSTTVFIEAESFESTWYIEQMFAYPASIYTGITKKIKYIYIFIYRKKELLQLI